MPSNCVGEAIVELLLTSERQVERGWIWLCSAINTLILHVTQNTCACMHMCLTSSPRPRVHYPRAGSFSERGMKKL